MNLSPAARIRNAYPAVAGYKGYTFRGMMWFLPCDTQACIFTVAGMETLTIQKAVCFLRIVKTNSMLANRADNPSLHAESSHPLVPTALAIVTYVPKHISAGKVSNQTNPVACDRCERRGPDNSGDGLVEVVPERQLPKGHRPSNSDDGSVEPEAERQASQGRRPHSSIYRLVESPSER